MGVDIVDQQLGEGFFAAEVLSRAGDRDGDDPGPYDFDLARVRLARGGDGFR